MNPMEKFIQHIVARLRVLEINDRVDLKSNKLNRNILIEKCETGFNVHENGINTKTFNNVPFQELPTILRVLVHKEFSEDPMIKVSILRSKDELSKEKTDAETGSEE